MERKVRKMTCHPFEGRIPSSGTRFLETIDQKGSNLGTVGVGNHRDLERERRIGICTSPFSVESTKLQSFWFTLSGVDTSRLLWSTCVSFDNPNLFSSYGPHWCFILRKLLVSVNLETPVTHKKFSLGNPQ